MTGEAQAAPAAPAVPAGSGLEYRRRAWTILGLLMLISATHQFHRGSLAALGDEIMRDHSISKKEFGLLLSIFFFSYTALMSPGGWLADRVGTWWTLFTVLAGSVIFGSACGLTGWLALGPAAAWIWIAAARTGMGITSAPIYPSTSKTVATWFGPRKQSLANGLVTGSATLGLGAAFLILGSLGKTALGWRGSFLVAGLVTIIPVGLWVILGRARPETAAAARGEAGSPPARPRLIGTAFRHRGIMALTLAYGTVGYFEYMLFFWMDLYLKGINVDPALSRLFTFIANLCFAVFTPLGGWLCGCLVRRRGLRRGLPATAMGAMALAAIFLSAAALTPNIYGKVILLWLAFGAIGASEGPFWTAAVLLGGPLGATSAGFVNTGGNLLGAFAPWLTPVIADGVNGLAGASKDHPLGWTAALIVGSLLCAGGLLLWRRVDLDRPLAEDQGTSDF